MKTKIKTGLAAILLLAISCTKENITHPSSAASQSTDKALSFAIGDHYGGGIIFYIDSTGQHGLIADTADFAGRKVWWNGTYIRTDAKGTAIGTGKSNTKQIVLVQGNSGLFYAARKCLNYRGSGYSDWFLPSKDELNELYKHKNVVGGFADYSYWSSSENYNRYVWRQNFRNGYQNYNFKSTTYYVRAVRAF